MASASASFTGPQYYDRLGPLFMDSFAADPGPCLLEATQRWPALEQDLAQ